MEGEAKPQILCNEVNKIFREEGFFTGQRYRRMEDQKPGPGLACNLSFATEKGLEPKVKKISETVEVGRRGEQTSLVRTYPRRGSRGRGRAIFWIFFWKKIAILMPFGTHFARF